MHFFCYFCWWKKQRFPHLWQLPCRYICHSEAHSRQWKPPMTTASTEKAGPSRTRDAGENMFMLDFDGRKHQTWQVWWNNNSALRFTLLYDPDNMTKWQMGQLFMKFRRAELRDQELPKDHEPMALWCAGDRTRTGACWGMELGCEWNCGVFVQTKISVFFNGCHRVT